MTFLFSQYNSNQIALGNVWRMQFSFDCKILLRLDGAAERAILSNRFTLIEYELCQNFKSLRTQQQSVIIDLLIPYIREGLIN